MVERDVKWNISDLYFFSILAFLGKKHGKALMHSPAYILTVILSLSAPCSVSTVLFGSEQLLFSPWQIFSSCCTNWRPHYCYNGSWWLVLLAWSVWLQLHLLGGRSCWHSLCGAHLYQPRTSILCWRLEICSKVFLSQTLHTYTMQYITCDKWLLNPCVGTHITEGAVHGSQTPHVRHSTESMSRYSSSFLFQPMISTPHLSQQMKLTSFLSSWYNVGTALLIKPETYILLWYFDRKMLYFESQFHSHGRWKERCSVNAEGLGMAFCDGLKSRL